MLNAYRAVHYDAIITVPGLFLNDDRGVGCILLNGLDAVGASGHCLIALAYSDYLAVGRFQAETVLACLVEIDLELGMLLGSKALFRLILNGSDGSVFLNAGYAVLAGRCGGIDLRCRDDFAVSGLEIKLYAGLGLLDKKCSHVFSS